MEKWNLYDENRQLTDKIIHRGEKIPHDLYRLVVHACIFNKKGQMLIQKRSGIKKSNPHIWDITLGGCAQMGETSKMAIKRELNEELGLDYNFSNERPFLTINFDSGFDDFYLIETSVSLKDIKFKDNEVERVKWASKKEILKMIKEKTFIQYHTSLIALLFDMRKHVEFIQKNNKRCSQQTSFFIFKNYLIYNCFKKREILSDILEKN